MDAHRKRHAPSLGVASAAGNTAGLIAPLTFPVEIREGPGGVWPKACGRPLRGGLGFQTTEYYSGPFSKPSGGQFIFRLLSAIYRHSLAFS